MSEFWQVPQNYRIGRTYGFSSFNVTNELSELLFSPELNSSSTFQFFVESSGGKLVPFQLDYSPTLLSKIKRDDVSFHYHTSCSAYLTSKNSNVVSYSRTYVESCLKNIRDYPMDVVIHSGTSDSSSPSKDISKTVNQICVAVRSSTPGDRRILLLENSCGKTKNANRTFCSVDEFQEVAEGIDDSSRIGFCLDTCHSFAAGVSRWNSYEDTIEKLEQINSILEIKCIHLNDSNEPYNSSKDSHRIPMKGYIWKESENQEGLSAIVNFCNEKKIDMITEGNKNRDSVKKETRTFEKLSRFVKEQKPKNRDL